MARIRQCGIWANAKKEMLVSEKPAYHFQIVYHIEKCKGHHEAIQPDGTVRVSLCQQEHMQWQGQYSDGTFTEFFDIEPKHFATWKRRTEKEKAAPQPQMTSEYSQRVKRTGPQVLSYLKKLDEGLKWWKGNKIPEQRAES